ncbi:MAG TPA: DALR domain-containing protein, partial [Thermoplasmata archaeon]|nr:DALR domain-containing protein [Thermoplasmata archaeon]
GRDLPAEIAARSSELVERLDVELAQDFNTREAIALLFGWGRTLSDWLPHLEALSGSALATLAAPYRWATEVLGLFGSGAVGPGSQDLDRVVGATLAARARARARGDYAESDRIRSELSEAGIVVEDGPDGARWHPDASGAD